MGLDALFITHDRSNSGGDFVENRDGVDLLSYRPKTIRAGDGYS